MPSFYKSPVSAAVSFELMSHVKHLCYALSNLSGNSILSLLKIKAKSFISYLFSQMLVKLFPLTVVSIQLRFWMICKLYLTISCWPRNFSSAVLRTVCLNFCALLIQNSSTRRLAKAKLTGNVILLKVVCSYTIYDNAFVKMCVWCSTCCACVLWHYCSCSVCLRMKVLVLD